MSSQRCAGRSCPPEVSDVSVIPKKDLKRLVSTKYIVPSAQASSTLIAQFFLILWRLDAMRKDRPRVYETVRKFRVPVAFARRNPLVSETFPKQKGAEGEWSDTAYVNVAFDETDGVSDVPATVKPSTVTEETTADLKAGSFEVRYLDLIELAMLALSSITRFGVPQDECHFEDALPSIEAFEEYADMKGANDDWRPEAVSSWNEFVERFGGDVELATMAAGGDRRSSVVKETRDLYYEVDPESDKVVSNAYSEPRVRAYMAHVQRVDDPDLFDAQEYEQDTASLTEGSKQRPYQPAINFAHYYLRMLTTEVSSDRGVPNALPKFGTIFAKEYDLTDEERNEAIGDDVDVDDGLKNTWSWNAAWSDYIAAVVEKYRAKTGSQLQSSDDMDAIFAAGGAEKLKKAMDARANEQYKVPNFRSVAAHLMAAIEDYLDSNAPAEIDRGLYQDWAPSLYPNKKLLAYPAKNDSEYNEFAYDYARPAGARYADRMLEPHYAADQFYSTFLNTLGTRISDFAPYLPIRFETYHERDDSGEFTAAAKSLQNFEKQFNGFALGESRAAIANQPVYAVDDDSAEPWNRYGSLLTFVFDPVDSVDTSKKNTYQTVYQPARRDVVGGNPFYRFFQLVDSYVLGSANQRAEIEQSHPLVVQYVNEKVLPEVQRVVADFEPRHPLLERADAQDDDDAAAQVEAAFDPEETTTWDALLPAFAIGPSSESERREYRDHALSRVLEYISTSAPFNRRMYANTVPFSLLYDYGAHAVELIDQDIVGNMMRQWQAAARVGQKEDAPASGEDASDSDASASNVSEAMRIAAAEAANAVAAEEACPSPESSLDAASAAAFEAAGDSGDASSASAPSEPESSEETSEEQDDEDEDDDDDEGDDEGDDEAEEGALFADDDDDDDDSDDEDEDYGDDDDDVGDSDDEDDDDDEEEEEQADAADDDATSKKKTSRARARTTSVGPRVQRRKKGRRTAQELKELLMASPGMTQSKYDHKVVRAWSKAQQPLTKINDVGVVSLEGKKTSTWTNTVKAFTDMFFDVVRTYKTTNDTHARDYKEYSALKTAAQKRKWLEEKLKRIDMPAYNTYTTKKGKAKQAWLLKNVTPPSEPKNDAEVWSDAVECLKAVGFYSSYSDQRKLQMNEDLFTYVLNELRTLIDDKYDGELDGFLDHLATVTRYAEDEDLDKIRTKIAYDVPKPQYFERELRRELRADVENLDPTPRSQQNLALISLPRTVGQLGEVDTFTEKGQKAISDHVRMYTEMAAEFKRTDANRKTMTADEQVESSHKLLDLKLTKDLAEVDKMNVDKARESIVSLAASGGAPAAARLQSLTGSDDSVADVDELVDALGDDLDTLRSYVRTLQRQNAEYSKSLVEQRIRAEDARSRHQADPNEDEKVPNEPSPETVLSNQLRALDRAQADAQRRIGGVEDVQDLRRVIQGLVVELDLHASGVNEMFPSYKVERRNQLATQTDDSDELKRIADELSAFKFTQLRQQLEDDTGRVQEIRRASAQEPKHEAQSRILDAERQRDDDLREELRNIVSHRLITLAKLREMFPDFDGRARVDLLGDLDDTDEVESAILQIAQSEPGIADVDDLQSRVGALRAAVDSARQAALAAAVLVEGDVSGELEDRPDTPPPPGECPTALWAREQVEAGTNDSSTLQLVQLIQDNCRRAASAGASRRPDGVNALATRYLMDHQDEYLYPQVTFTALASVIASREPSNARDHLIKQLFRYGEAMLRANNVLMSTTVDAYNVLRDDVVGALRVALADYASNGNCEALREVVAQLVGDFTQDEDELHLVVRDTMAGNVVLSLADDVRHVSNLFESAGKDFPHLRLMYPAIGSRYRMYKQGKAAVPQDLSAVDYRDMLRNNLRLQIQSMAHSLGFVIVKGTGEAFSSLRENFSNNDESSAGRAWSDVCHRRDEAFDSSRIAAVFDNAESNSLVLSGEGRTVSANEGQAQSNLSADDRALLKKKVEVCYERLFKAFPGCFTCRDQLGVDDKRFSDDPTAEYTGSVSPGNEVVVVHIYADTLVERTNAVLPIGSYALDRTNFLTLTLAVFADESEDIVDNLGTRTVAIRSHYCEAFGDQQRVRFQETVYDRPAWEDDSRVVRRQFAGNANLFFAVRRDDLYPRGDNVDADSLAGFWVGGVTGELYLEQPPVDIQYNSNVGMLRDCHIGRERNVRMRIVEEQVENDATVGSPDVYARVRVVNVNDPNSPRNDELHNGLMVEMLCAAQSPRKQPRLHGVGFFLMAYALAFHSRYDPPTLTLMARRYRPQPSGRVKAGARSLDDNLYTEATISYYYFKHFGLQFVPMRTADNALATLDDVHKRVEFEMGTKYLREQYPALFRDEQSRSDVLRDHVDFRHFFNLMKDASNDDGNLMLGNITAESSVAAICKFYSPNYYWQPTEEQEQDGVSENSDGVMFRYYPHLAELNKRVVEHYERLAERFNLDQQVRAPYFRFQGDVDANGAGGFNQLGERIDHEAFALFAADRDGVTRNDFDQLSAARRRTYRRQAANKILEQAQDEVETDSELEFSDDALSEVASENCSNWDDVSESRAT